MNAHQAYVAALTEMLVTSPRSVGEISVEMLRRGILIPVSPGNVFVRPESLLRRHAVAALEYLGCVPELDTGAKLAAFGGWSTGLFDSEVFDEIKWRLPVSLLRTAEDSR